MSLMQLTAEDTLTALGQEQLIAVLRCESYEDALWASELLIKTGIQCIEVTFSVPDAPILIAHLVEKFQDAVIGAGSIFTPEELKLASSAGAEFLVSPILNPELIRLGEKKNVLTIVGAASPTEIYSAAQQGAKAVKVFPVHQLGGVDYLKAIQEPMGRLNIPLIPTGGVNKQNMVRYLKEGVWAVGLGSALASVEAMKNRDEFMLVRNAETLLETYKNYKNMPLEGPLASDIDIYDV